MPCDCDGAARASTVIALTGSARPLWCGTSEPGHQPENATMATKEQVLAALEGVPSPDGTALPRTGSLSDVVAGDGKVFFSITVDAAEVKAWESVRKRAEEVVRAMPGVTSALVALTAERRAGAPQPQPQSGAAPAGARPGPRGEAMQGVPGVGAIIAVASGKGGVG